MLTLDLWLCRTGPNRRSARYNRDELAPSHRLLQKGPTALFSTLATKGIELANHRGFFEAGKRLLKRARFARQPMALIMFDLDRFKSINDRYGHHTGDEVLTAFCQLASSQLRPNDLFGRIGGEEFASLLPDTGHHDAVWRSERVRSAFETSFPHLWTTWIRLNRQRRDCDYGQL
jgi:GGDEF domain-containing protein